MVNEYSAGVDGWQGFYADGGLGAGMLFYEERLPSISSTKLSTRALTWASE